VLLVPAAYKPADMPASAPKPPPLAEKMLMTIVTSDFVFWLTARFAEETAIRMVLATPPEDFRAASADEQARARALLDRILPISARVQGLLNDARIAGNAPRYALEAIRAATLVVSVRDDLFGTYAAAQYTAQHIAGARFIGYERGGHVWLGHHREIMDETAAFVHNAAR
jgi:pimeloyl-ACP methyl ester carboxylesterase